MPGVTPRKLPRVVGYSRLGGVDDDRTLARLRALRSVPARPPAALHLQACYDEPEPEITPRRGESEMDGKFIIAKETKLDALDWGRIRWICSPASTGAAQLTIVEGSLIPGKGHDFHKHPHQEEVLFVVSGRIEQWIDKEKRLLGPGDAAFVPPDAVHASFNVGDSEAKIIAIFGPCIGDGFEMIDMAGEAPWNSLRG
jgi:quercetin dioxygenase-like cupin family protein